MAMVRHPAAAVKPSADHLFIVYICLLLAFGLLMLMSASAPVGYERFGDKYFFIKRQLLFGVLPGLLAYFIFSKLRYDYLERLAWPAFMISLVILALTYIPGIGSTFGTSSKSWLLIGNYSFQPAEFAKLGLIMFLALWITKQGRRLQDFKSGFLSTLALALIPVALVVGQPDVGTAVILFVIVFGMLFTGGARLAHLVGLALVGATSLAFMIAKAPYRAARWVTFLHPELDPLGIGYHMNQAFLAIGSGGWFGLGLGHSRQKFEYLPEVHADSIFAVVGEEMGFVFAVGLVIILLLIAYRGFQLAKQTRDQFGGLLVGGIMIWFAFQSFLNIGAMVGVLPLTGVPLPFVSHGGTALAMELAAVGLVVNVSRKIS